MAVAQGCVASSPQGFIYRVAHGFVQHGARFYITGRLPTRLSQKPEELDARLARKYGLERSRWTRYRRKEQGLCNLWYLRYDDFWLLMASKGSFKPSERSFFEGNNWADIQQRPLKFWGHSISRSYSTQDSREHTTVRIERREYLGLRAYMLGGPWRYSSKKVLEQFHRLPYEPYGGVRLQYRRVLEALNSKRTKAGLPRVPLAELSKLKVRVRSTTAQGRGRA